MQLKKNIINFLSRPMIRAANNEQEQFIEIIEAASKPINLKKCDGVAYSGGIVRQWWSRYPLVVDLAGMDQASQIPLLYSHINDPDYRLGAVVASMADFQLHVSGGISADTEKAKNIISQSKDFDWQLSIGAESHSIEFVEAGEKVTVNNREFTGPVNIVRRSLLKEVSVVAVGADADTHLKIAAKYKIQNHTENPSHEPIKGGQTMDPKTLAFIIAKFGLAKDASADVATQHISAIGLSVKDVEAMMPEESEGDGDDDVDTKLKAAGVVIQPIAASAPTGGIPKTAASNEPAPTPAPVQAGGLNADDVRTLVAEMMTQQSSAENERVQKIDAICADEFPAIRAQAVSENWTPEKTSGEVLKAMREDRPNANFNIIAKHPLEGTEHRDSITAALCLRSGIAGDDLVKELGEKAVEAGDQSRSISLKEVMHQCIVMEGKQLNMSFGNDNDLIRAAFSTVSLPGILSNVANKKMLKAYTAQPIIATKLCSEGDLNDFKESQRYRMTDVGDLEPVGADGEIKHGGVSEESASNQVKTYGKMFTLTRVMIINDDLGAFLKVPTNMGNRAARKIDQLFFARLLSNPNSLFSTAHKNYFTGATSALGLPSLKKGLQMYEDQVDSDGQPISISPRFLLVPTALYSDAVELTQSAGVLISGSTDRTVGTVNAISKYDLEVVKAPYLSNSKYTGNSSDAWYLWGDPSQIDTFEIGYLKGKRTPTVETGNVNFDTLGISHRCYFDLGVREQDHRGIVKSKGVA